VLFRSGEIIGSMCMSEPGAGTDVLGLTTTAKEDGDDFIINGTKMVRALESWLGGPAGLADPHTEIATFGPLNLGQGPRGSGELTAHYMGAHSATRVHALSICAGMLYW
jgi:hypothetical protein